jgi:hypothetical protein
MRTTTTILTFILLLSTAMNSEGAEKLSTDVCVVGGGSGGFSAALAAARCGADCILVERLSVLGGTSTAAYVCNWGPGPGDELAREIYDRLNRMPNAVGITRDHNPDRRRGSFGLWLPIAGGRYEDTLRKALLERDDRRAVVFDPDSMNKLMEQMLEETGRCRIMLGTTFTKPSTSGKRIEAIHVEEDSRTQYRISAKVFIDSTGGAHLCRAAGFPMMQGPDAKARFGEKLAPDTPGTTLNAISLCYRVRKSDNPKRQEAPQPPVKKWPRSAHVSGLPGGDLILNPLATVPGRDLIDDGYDACMDRAKRIVEAQWRWLQQNPTFAPYEFHSFAPTLGIRESSRVLGEYVLTEHDLEAGLSGQKHSDIVAVADHSMDVHGAGSKRVRGHLDHAYGVPYRCLIPKGASNLLVACRGASFSHIAASSCRLSRTIIQLGNAAGQAAAMAIEDQVPVGNIDVTALRKRLQPEKNCRQ